MKEVILSADEKYLILGKMRFKRPTPLSTIEVKVSTANLSDTRIDIKEDFVDAIKNFPDVNAFLNLGPIPGKLETEEREHEHSNVNFIITSYRFYKIEIYHLGE